MSQHTGVDMWAEPGELAQTWPTASVLLRGEGGGQKGPGVGSGWMALCKGLGANLLVLLTCVGGVCSPCNARSTWSGRGGGCMAGFHLP